VPDPRETVAYTLDAIRVTKRELAGAIPLIGFSGAPFTLASYAIEGGGSKDYRRTKQLMYREPAAWHALMTKLADLVGSYLRAQAEAGADALQIFDSWVGALSPADYVEYVLPYVQRAIAAARPQGAALAAPAVPVIYFGTDTAGLFGQLRHTGADVVGVDWRIALDDAWAILGPGAAVQGNLDPMTLFAPWPEIERRAKDILDRAAGRPGHIFNLGHGILTETPVDSVRRLVEFVHGYGAGQAR
jgi:uroporphyrinogen decarboxylase